MLSKRETLQSRLDSLDDHGKLISIEQFADLDCELRAQTSRPAIAGFFWEAASRLDLLTQSMRIGVAMYTVL